MFSSLYPDVFFEQFPARGQIAIASEGRRDGEMQGFIAVADIAAGEGFWALWTCSHQPKILILSLWDLKGKIGDGLLEFEEGHPMPR